MLLPCVYTPGSIHLVTIQQRQIAGTGLALPAGRRPPRPARGRNPAVEESDITTPYDCICPGSTNIVQNQATATKHAEVQASIFQVGIICASEDHLGSQVGSCIGEQEVSKVYSRKPAPNKLPSKQPLNAHTHVSLYRAHSCLSVS